MTNAIRRRMNGGSDAGIALVMTLGIMMVGAVLLVTLAAVTVFNTQRTLKTRVEAQALQSADAGIDLVQQMLEGLKYNELATVCGTNIGDFVINGDTVEVTTQYTVSRAGATVEVECPLASDITQALEVTATATARPLIGDSTPVTRAVRATFVPTPPEAFLDKAIFSEGSTTITNNSKLYESSPGANDAHVYSNGGVTCKTQVDTGGSIYAAQGDVIIENTCEIGNSVWASGKITLSSQSKIYGDAYAASSAATYGISLANSNSQIVGAALTNGGIYNAGRISQGGGILGSAFARTGKIVLDNQGEIGGSAYAGGNIEFNNGSKVGQDAYAKGGNITAQNSNNTAGGHARATGTIASNLIAATKTPNTTVVFPNTPNPADVFPPSVGYPNAIQAPPREQFPIIKMYDGTPPNYDDGSQGMWRAGGWAIVTVNNQCTGNNAANAVNSIQASATGPTMIIFKGCASPVQFNNHQFTISQDIALVSDTGFQSQNLHKIYSSNLSVRHKWFWIVPADAPGVSWTSTSLGQLKPSCTSPAGNITVDKIKVWSIDFMFYTPCTFNWSNGTDLGGGSEPFTGQIYSGQVNMPNATEIKMQSMPIPSLVQGAANPDSEAKMNLTARFDVHS